MIVEANNRPQRASGGPCLAVLADAACSRHAGVPATPFPASNEVAGWVKTGDTRTFSATELWSYIDGDAERYVKAGVQSTASTADYNFQNTFDAVVDIYTMGDAKGARTILEGEPAGQAKSVQLGDSGRLYTGQPDFLQGTLSGADRGLQAIAGGATRPCRDWAARSSGDLLQ